MKLSTRISKWLLQETDDEESQTSGAPEEKAPWWKVMCLTGVDYFSTLGYQPSVAFLAAGLLAPIATLILVIVTLFAALPTYKWVAKYSPNGQGSVLMLERLMPGWTSKILVLVLLGFAGMGFIITITLSSADAAQHVVENPLVGDFLHSRTLVTILLISLLGGVFLKGFKEVIGIAVILVAVYISLNLILLVWGVSEIIQHPSVIQNWWQQVFAQNPSVMDMLVVCVIVFPRLALGLSGFETGVMVMPLVDGGKEDEKCDEDGNSLHLGRIENTKKLLTAAALIMSVLLVLSSVVTSLLIPVSAMQAGGEADGRALAYLAHHAFGNSFGTLYDLSTIAILWFAGASAMAGLVNLVPRYLPRYGMAPEWAGAVRPLVLVFTAICFFVTFVFGADVHSQSSAYATGVLVFLTAAAFAVTLALWDRGVYYRVGFTIISLVFIYTTFANIFERPDGVQVAAVFIVAIMATSITSRVWRSTELRISGVEFDTVADGFIKEAIAKYDRLNLVAHRFGGSAYAVKKREMAYKHNVQEESVIMIEVKVSDSSTFTEEVVSVRGTSKGEGGHPVLQCSGPSVANVLAAVTLHIRDNYEVLPDIYFAWSESGPFEQAFKFIFTGEGEAALLTREVLRSHEQEIKTRPKVHVA